jgi:hypothetical protein
VPGKSREYLYIRVIRYSGIREILMLSGIHNGDDSI